MSERLSANAMLIRSWTDGLPDKNRIAVVELFDTIELSRQQCKEEIQSLKEQLRESNRRRDIAEECVDHYAGYPFSTNDIYMDIFELFKIENSSVTSFDSGTFAKKAIEARAKRGEG